MHVAFTRLFEAYDKIGESAACSGGASSLLIFVTPEVDSICALKILTVLLRSDSILYEILPISSYTDLSVANEVHIKNNHNLRSIITLGCGALVDTSSILTPNEQVKIHIIDSHRPYNLKSLFSNLQVLIWDDGSVQDLEKVKHAYLALGSIERVNTEFKESALECLNSLPDEVLSQNAKSLQSTLHSYYNSFIHSGMSVSGLLYTLSTQLGRQTQTFLWMAIVGLTDKLLNDSITPKSYDMQTNVYRQELIRLSGSSLRKTPGMSSQADDLETLDNTKDEVAYGAGDNSVRFGHELKFTLLRHWSLYESMYHSVFVSSRLQLWREKGRRKLINLLVKMGLPHKESFQLYSQMSVSYKRAVKERLIRIAPKYNMNHIVFQSFRKHYGYKGTLSASDMVHSLTTILQFGLFETSHLQTDYMPSSTLKKFTPEKDSELAYSSEFSSSRLAGIGAGTLSNSCYGLKNVHDYYPKTSSTPQPQWVSNFYMAYDALGSFDILYHGITSSISLQKLLVATGVTILEKNLMQVLTGFQLAILRSNSSNPVSITSSNFKSISGEYSLFGKSESYLCGLTKFLYKTYVRYKKKLPTVVAAFNPEKNTYLIASFAECDVLNSLKTPLGVAFQKAADRIGISITRHSFYTTVIEVSQDDISDFLESLQICIS